MNEALEAAAPPARPRNFHQSAFWRRFARFGASRGPGVFVRWSPPLIGLLFALLLPAARRMVVRNQRLVFGPRDALREAWDVVRTFSAFASCLAESLGSDRREGRAPRVRVRGGQRVVELTERRQGFIVATAHVGPWDGAAQALANHRGVPILVVMAREDDAAAEALHDQVRGQADVSVLRIGRHPLDALPALEHLERGGVVAVQLDRVPRGSPSVVTRLFGEEFPVPLGPFQLAGLARVPIVPIFSARTGHFARRIDVGYGVQPPRRPRGAELGALAQELVTQMEGHIAAFPEQWFHFVSDDEQSLALGAAGGARGSAPSR